AAREHARATSVGIHAGEDESAGSGFLKAGRSTDYTTDGDGGPSGLVLECIRLAGCPPKSPRTGEGHRSCSVAYEYLGITPKEGINLVGDGEWRGCSGRISIAIVDRGGQHSLAGDPGNVACAKGIIVIEVYPGSVIQTNTASPSVVTPEVDTAVTGGAVGCPEDSRAADYAREREIGCTRLQREVACCC